MPTTKSASLLSSTSSVIVGNSQDALILSAVSTLEKLEKFVEIEQDDMSGTIPSSRRSSASSRPFPMVIPGPPPPSPASSYSHSYAFRNDIIPKWRSAIPRSARSSTTSMDVENDIDTEVGDCSVANDDFFESTHLDNINEGRKNVAGEQEPSLEDLVSLLRSQIRESTWLTDNKPISDISTGQ